MIINYIEFQHICELIMLLVVTIEMVVLILGYYGNYY